MWSWGSNSLGQLGNGSATNSNTPIQVGNDNDWESITSGQYHCFAKKTNNTFFNWGWNGWGQLGDGTTINKNIPTLFSDCALNTSPIEKQETFVVYPNPANNELNIIGKDEINRVEIFDLLGKSLLIQNKAISKIDIQFLTPGFYLLKVNSSSRKQQIKFIKS